MASKSVEADQRRLRYECDEIPLTTLLQHNQQQQMLVSQFQLHPKRRQKCVKIVMDRIPSLRKLAGKAFSRVPAPLHYCYELSGLPFELVDAILEKSYLHWILNSLPEQRDEDVIKALASVDFCWFQRIRRRRFKIRIWRRLKDFYGKTKKRTTIIRNNRNYLLENIQPSVELFDSLLSLNCVKKEQIQFIQRQRSVQDKNVELLYVMETFDETEFSTFVNCLRLTNQKTVARILTNGGVVIKVEIITRGETPIESQHLHAKFKDLQDRSKSRSRETDKFINQLTAEGIHILNSQLAGQNVIVWIWCRSQAALKYIYRFYKSTQMTNFLFGVTNIQSFASEVEQLTMVNIERNEFKKTVVVCPISTTFTERIDVGEFEKAVGFTKLRNEIYVLCKTTSLALVIRTFEDQHPFRLQEKIQLSTQEEDHCYVTGDIVCSESEKSLYVCGEKNRIYHASDILSCQTQKVPLKPDDPYNDPVRPVWKINIKTVDQHKITRWLKIDYSLWTISVSSDGRLLLGQWVHMHHGASILMIYGSDAELIRSIQLSGDIKDPRHAVETSIGTFIIIHSIIKEHAPHWEYEWMSVVSEMAGDGQTIIRRFLPSNEIQKLHSPSHLSLDADDQVLVKDYDDRVIMLDSDLKWDRILLSSKEDSNWIRYSDKIFFDEEKKQLIVGGGIFSGGAINVYTLSGT